MIKLNFGRTNRYDIHIFVVGSLGCIQIPIVNIVRYGKCRSGNIILGYGILLGEEPDKCGKQPKNMNYCNS